MLFFNFLALTISQLAVLAAAAPAAVGTEARSASCVNPPVRKEWRKLTSSQKITYINAVHCLTKLPAKSGIAGTINRFDDFHAVHNNQTPNIHWVGHFILWHRQITALYKKALIQECGLPFGQPYWDWSLDVSSNETSMAVYDSPVFDTVTGFGGNGPYLPTNDSVNVFGLTGRTGGGCVSAGPFTADKFSVNYPTPHCLTRDFIPWIMNSFAQQSLVDHVLAQPDFTSFAKAVENVPNFNFPNIHGSGHFGVVGVLGTIGDAYNSPGDPLFYLHHANLDRIFTEWQYVNLTQRLNEVGGPVLPFDYSGVNVTMGFEINLGPLSPNITLKTALNSQGSFFCYSHACLDE